VLERMEDEHRHELDDVASKLHDKTSEAATLRLDADRLRVIIDSYQLTYLSDINYFYSTGDWRQPCGGPGVCG